MSFLKQLARLFAPAPAARTGQFLPVTVRCRRCGETIVARIHLANDLSAGDDAAFVCRKVLLGRERCFEAIEVVLTFDAQRNLIDRAITGGTFVDGPAADGAPAP